MNKDVRLVRRQRRRYQKIARQCREPETKDRYMIIVHLAKGKRIKDTAEAVGRCERTVRRTRDRWLAMGEAGLLDGREDNAGQAKVTKAYQETLYELLRGTPQDVGYRRPRWTLKLIRDAAQQRTGIRLSRSRLSRVLRSMGAKWKRARPVVSCPWPKRRRQRRLREVRQLVNQASDHEPVYWEDEVDIELNPRIGADGSLPGQQRCIETPGQNQKRYLAGVIEARTDEAVWVQGQKKNSQLFIDLLKKLLRLHPNARRIHLILDNYRIHSSRQVQQWLQDWGQRIRLLFLPPYCPDENRIERCLWREVHEHVTYNHLCETIEELVEAVLHYLRNRNRRIRRQMQR